MTLIRLVCCVTAVFLATPSMGRELPIGQLATPSSIHHHVGGHHRVHPKSCLDVPHRVSGVYSIQPEWPFHDPILVYCDQEYETGGWAVIQRRFDGKLNFERPEKDYRYGFGNLDGEFWLGLENIYRLLEAPHELLVILEDFAGNTSYARYEQFEIGKSERYIIPQYAIRKCESYHGTAGNGWPYLQNGDIFKSKTYTFGFWHGDKSNLNGRYTLPNAPVTQGELFWGDIKIGAIKATKMLIRPTISKLPERSSLEGPGEPRI